MGVVVERMVQLVDERVDKQKSHLQDFVLEKIVESEEHIDHSNKMKTLKELEEKFNRFDREMFEDREKFCSYETRVFELEKKLKSLQAMYMSEQAHLISKLSTLEDELGKQKYQGKFSHHGKQQHPPHRLNTEERGYTRDLLVHPHGAVGFNT